MTPVPDFPSELVEAAAKAIRPLAGRRPEAERLADDAARAVIAAVIPLIEQRARLDERERLSSRVHENGWCPTCARDTDEAAMQRLAGKSLESLSRNDLIGLALRNLNAAMDAEPRADAAEQRVIDRLAGEAGSNPYPDVRDPTTAHARRVWSEGAACGVAAERARTDDVDGWRVYCHNGEDASASIAHVLTPGDSVTFHECDAIHVRFDPLSAALAPERTGEGNDA